MIRSQHRPFYVWFFRIYTNVMLHRHFRNVTLKGRFEDQGFPVLMIGNHFSWWDGFIANRLNLGILNRKIHVMMLEEQLEKRKFLCKAGAFSIKKSSRSAIESLKYAAELLNNPENLVVIYPQGEFQSLYERQVRFEKGVKLIAAGAERPFHLLFYAALPEYFSHIRPVLNIYIREVRAELARNPQFLESEYNRFLDDCIKLQKPD
jgi:1-acyl-sn-glycerol-3-phosphate acyltransferase